MSPIAGGRNDLLFASSFRAGKRAAAVIRLMQSTRKNGFDSYAYLCDVVAHLPMHRANQIGELLPHRWLSTCQRPLKRLRPRVKMGWPRAYSQSGKPREVLQQVGSTVSSLACAIVPRPWSDRL